MSDRENPESLVCPDCNGRRWYLSDDTEGLYDAVACATCAQTPENTAGPDE